MAKIHRLRRAEWIAWRENTPQLCNDKGEPVRALSVPEEEHIARLVEQATRGARSLEKTVEVADPTCEGGKRKLKIEVSATQTPQSYVVTKTRVDGMERRTAREIICAGILAANEGNDVQLRRPNNTILKTLRDPTRLRPTSADANRTVPKPEFCECRHWGAPHPGVHHRICQYNKHAPPEEQAPEDEAGAPSDVSMQGVPTPTLGQGIQADTVHEAPGVTPVETIKAPHPKDCQCAKWARPEGSDPNQHHYMCSYKEQWEREQAIEAAQSMPELFLFDSEGNKVRKATDEEVTTADDNLKKHGARNVVIDDVEYQIKEDNTVEADAVETYYLAHPDTGERLRRADSEEIEQSLVNEESTGLRSVEVDGDMYIVQKEEIEV